MTGEKAWPSLPPQVLRTPESCQKISAKAPSMITTANAPVCPPVWGTKMEKHLSLSGSQWVSVGLSGSQKLENGPSNFGPKTTSGDSLSV